MAGMPVFGARGAYGAVLARPSVRQPVPLSIFGCGHPEHSVQFAHQHDVDVSAVFWASHSTLLCGKSAVSHSIWAAWGCRAVLARSTRFVGAAGLQNPTVAALTYNDAPLPPLALK